MWTTGSRRRGSSPAGHLGQAILNSTGAREPEHTFNRPVPITARIVWENDGEEHLDTVALGWTGRHVYVRMDGPRYRFTAVWLDAAMSPGDDDA
jgi:hypothetical protein